MEEGLLEREESRWKITHEWDEFSEELKKMTYIAAPMVAVSVLQYLLQVVSMMMVGHFGQITLSGVAIATSLTNVTGFSLLSGLVGGLETLCGQAYGAQQWQKFSIYTYSAIISLLLVCIPISVSWLFMDKLLILLGQDPAISVEAFKYSIWLIPALFGGAILRPLFRYLQTQSLILPMLYCAFVVLPFHITVCWLFIFKLELGSIGAAIAFSFSIWTFVVLLVFYIYRSSSCERTRAPLTKDAFLAIGQFFRYAIPSALMICLKWWSLEVIILLSGLLPNPKLETSVLSICLTLSTLHFGIPYGFGVAASTRVSNELGAGNPRKALTAVKVAMLLAVIETAIVSTVTFSCRGVLGKAYSDEKEVVDYVAAMTPFLCLSIVTDSLQAVISGIARGSGWQHIGAYVNLGAFYLVGIPVASILGFVVHLKAKGLWIGIVVGSALQATILVFILGFTDWQNQAIKAKKRLSEGRSSEDNRKP